VETQIYSGVDGQQRCTDRPASNLLETFDTDGQMARHHLLDAYPRPSGRLTALGLVSSLFRVPL